MILFYSEDIAFFERMKATIKRLFDVRFLQKYSTFNNANFEQVLIYHQFTLIWLKFRANEIPEENGFVEIMKLVFLIQKSFQTVNSKRS